MVTRKITRTKQLRDPTRVRVLGIDKIAIKKRRIVAGFWSKIGLISPQEETQLQIILLNCPQLRSLCDSFHRHKNLKINQFSDQPGLNSHPFFSGGGLNGLSSGAAIEIRQNFPDRLRDFE